MVNNHQERVPWREFDLASNVNSELFKTATWMAVNLQDSEELEMPEADTAIEDSDDEQSSEPTKFIGVTLNPSPPPISTCLRTQLEMDTGEPGRNWTREMAHRMSNVKIRANRALVLVLVMICSIFIGFWISVLVNKQRVVCSPTTVINKPVVCLTNTNFEHEIISNSMRFSTCNQASSDTSSTLAMFPSQAAIVGKTSELDTEYICDGFIIDEFAVLVQASCYRSIESRNYIQLYISFGNQNYLNVQLNRVCHLKGDYAMLIPNAPIHLYNRIQKGCIGEIMGPYSYDQHNYVLQAISTRFDNVTITLGDQPIRSESLITDESCRNQYRAFTEDNPKAIVLLPRAGNKYNIRPRLVFRHKKAAPAYQYNSYLMPSTTESTEAYDSNFSETNVVGYVGEACLADGVLIWVEFQPIQIPRVLSYTCHSI